MKTGTVLCVIVSGALACSANAGFFTESEPNNTLGTADPVGNYLIPGDAFLVDGTISPAGDLDYFVFTVSGPTEIRASIYGRPNSNVGDSTLTLLDFSGATLAFDDNGGINLFSSLEFNTVSGGTYYFKAAGVGASTFDYKLVVGLNIVPAPGAMALMAMGGILASRRRR